MTDLKGETISQHIAPGADEYEHATPLYSCDGVLMDLLIFGSNFLWNETPMKVP